MDSNAGVFDPKAELPLKQYLLLYYWVGQLYELPKWKNRDKNPLGKA